MPKYIYRREIPGEAYSWLVSLLCSPNHDRHSFSDSKHGGKEGALAVAIEYRDKVIKTQGWYWWRTVKYTATGKQPTQLE